MTAKEFLQRFFVLQQRIESCLDEITNLQSIAKQTTHVMNDVPCGGVSSKSRIENSVVDIQRSTEKLADELALAVDVRAEIAEIISRVENNDERYLLELRYLCFYSWETIAKKMRFSLQWIFKLHDRALKNFVFNQSVE